MFKSVCAEYEIRKWHEPTCSGSKYLNVKHQVSKIRNTTHYSKCTELNEEEEKMVGMGNIWTVHAWVCFFRPRHSLPKMQFQHHWTESMPAKLKRKDKNHISKVHVVCSTKKDPIQTWKPAAFSNVAILCTKPKAENTWKMFQFIINISNVYKKRNKTTTETLPDENIMGQQKNSKQMSYKCRMTPVHICVTLERSMTYMIIIPNCFQQKNLNKRHHHLWFNWFQ